MIHKNIFLIKNLGRCIYSDCRIVSIEVNDVNLICQDWVRSLSLRRMYNRDVLSWCQVSIVLVTIQIILTTLEHKNILPTLTIIKYILTFYFYI